MENNICALDMLPSEPEGRVMCDEAGVTCYATRFPGRDPR